jgi:hypothetical protein
MLLVRQSKGPIYSIEQKTVVTIYRLSRLIHDNIGNK